MPEEEDSNLLLQLSQLHIKNTNQEVMVESKLLKSINKAKNTPNDGKSSQSNKLDFTMALVKDIHSNIYPMKEIIEYLPEDVESMIRECNQWDSILEKANLNYEKELDLTSAFKIESEGKMNELLLKIKNINELIKISYHNMITADSKDDKIISTILK